MQARDRRQVLPPSGQPVCGSTAPRLIRLYVRASRFFRSPIKSGFHPLACRNIQISGVVFSACFDTNLGVLGSQTTSECLPNECRVASLCDRGLARFGFHGQLLTMCRTLCQRAAVRSYIALVNDPRGTLVPSLRVWTCYRV